MLLPKRHASDESYRYGFQGSEKDDELKGEGNSYTTHFRQYDPRIGRWFTIDPKIKLIPFDSPYSYSNNMPIFGNDPDGDICPPCAAIWAAFKAYQGAELLIGAIVTYAIYDQSDNISNAASIAYERTANGAANLFSDAPLPVVSGGFDKYPIPQIGVETIPAVKEKLRERILEEVLPVVESAQLREGFDLLPLDLQAQRIEKIPAFKDSNFSNSVLNSNGIAIRNSDLTGGVHAPDTDINVAMSRAARVGPNGQPGTPQGKWLTEEAVYNAAALYNLLEGGIQVVDICSEDGIVIHNPVISYPSGEKGPYTVKADKAILIPKADGLHLFPIDETHPNYNDNVKKEEK